MLFLLIALATPLTDHEVVEADYSVVLWAGSLVAATTTAYGLTQVIESAERYHGAIYHRDADTARDHNHLWSSVTIGAAVVSLALAGVALWSPTEEPVVSLGPGGLSVGGHF